MDSLQLDRILKSCPITRKHYRGVHPYDHVDFCIKKNISSKLRFFIFNTEETGSPGMHWVSLTIQGRKAIFFDSLNLNPNIVFRRLLEILQNLNFTTILTNPFRIQQYSSDVCGHHTIYFALLKCLKTPRKKIFSLHYKKGQCKTNDAYVKKIVERIFPSHF